MIRMDGSKIARVLTDPIDSLFHDSHSFFTLTLFSPLCFSFFQFHVACASCADVLYTCLFFIIFVSLRPRWKLVISRSAVVCLNLG